MSTAPSPRRRDAAQNRAGLVAAAAAALGEDPHSSIDTIARAAGLSRRAFYGHFADRDEMLSAVISAAGERFNAIAAAVTDDDPRVALLHLSRALWDEAAHVHSVAAVAVHETFAHRVADALDPLRQRLTEICTEGHARGVLRRDLPPAVTARLVEESVRAVITRMDAAVTEAHSLATRAALGVAGLDWREIEDLLREQE